MNARHLWFAPALLLAAALAGSGAEDEPPADSRPAGAKLRFGTARLRFEMFSVTLLTPDGKSLFAATSGGLTRFDPATGAAQGKPQKLFGGTLAGVSADGNRLAQLAYNGATVWDVAAGKALVKVERRLPSTPSPIALSDDGKTLALGGANTFGKMDAVTVLVWNVDADKEVQKIAVPQNQSASVAVSGNGKTVATWGTHYDPDAKGLPDPDTNPNRFVHFWDAATGNGLGKFRAAGYAPGTVALNADGSVAAVSNGNGSIDLVDPKTGTSKALLLGRTRMGQWIAFSPDGATVAATGDDGAVQRWAVADGTRRSTTEPPVPNLVGARVRLPNNESGVAWCQRGAAVVVWAVPSGKVISPDGGHTTAVRSITVSPDNAFVFTSADDGTVLKWDLATGKPAGSIVLRQPVGFGGYMPYATLSPDLSRALVRDSSGLPGVYDVALGTQQFTLPMPDGVTAAAFNADGSKAVVTASNFDPKRMPGSASVWDLAAGKRVLNLTLPGQTGVAAALTPDGKHLVTVGRKTDDKGGGEFVVASWDAATGAKKGEFAEETGFSQPFVVAGADNKTAAVVTPKGRLVAFDVATGKVGKTYDLNRRVPIFAPVFSSDGKMLAVVTQPDFTEERTAPVLVLDAATGAVKHSFGAKGGTPTALAFSPDGKWLVTGSSDTTATVWDLSK